MDGTRRFPPADGAAPHALPAAVARSLKGVLSDGARVAVALSGGRDSVALLRLLLDLGFHKLVVCHLDHGLRGAASRADAHFVMPAFHQGLGEAGHVEGRTVAIEYRWAEGQYEQ